MGNIEFKDNLARILKEKRMKAADLSRSSGVSEASISEYLNGKKKPAGKTCIALAKGLKISLDELLATDYIEKEKPAPLEDELESDIKELFEIWERLTIENRKELLSFAKFREDGQSQ